MADTFKPLYTTSANRCPSTTNLTAVYTVPSSTSAMVSHIVVANLGGIPQNFRIAILPSGVVVGGIANEYYLAFDVAIPANDSIIFTVGGGLAAGETIAVRSSQASVLTFNPMGMEIT